MIIVDVMLTHISQYSSLDRVWESELVARSACSMHVGTPAIPKRSGGQN